jgi:hypothetical protein
MRCGMPGHAEPSFVELVKEILANVEQIFRSEVRLAKAEVKEEIGRGSKAGVVLGAGVIMAFYSVGFLLLSAVYALSLRLPLWGSALLTGAFAGVVALLLILTGRQRIRQVHLKPERTIETVKENVAWMRQQVK